MICAHATPVDCPAAWRLRVAIAGGMFYALTRSSLASWLSRRTDSR